MKAKILIFLGLIIAVTGLALIFNSTTAHALGEKYQWVDSAKIEGSGPAYKLYIGNDTTLTYSGKGDTYTALGTNEKTGCTKMTLTIKVKTDTTGTLSLKCNVGSFAIQPPLDKNITIAHPEKRGGKSSGTEVNYLDANCNDKTQNGGDATRCAAVQGCTRQGKGQANCLSAYKTCFANYTKDGKLSDTDKKNCIKYVTAGDVDKANEKPQPADKTKESCVVDGIGWIICPVLSFVSQVVDASYDVVSSLLTVQPLLSTGDPAEATLYSAWSIMRNFANVAFVIAFIIIIFSQLSSIGISNYGIKKMLPRLVIAAILVNISYWVCAIAIDASNILGSSLKGLFDTMGLKIAAPSNSDISIAASGKGWVGITGAILAGVAGLGVILYASLSALVPILLAVLLAIVTVFIVLALRQALIVLLVIVAPLAFVAYLLPNTESLFKKWKDLLQTLLLMYPIIALIFGASALASKIVMTSASADSAISEAQKIAIQLMGAGIAIIPLAITPIVMKTAGGLLNRFGGIVNNPTKGLHDRLRNKAVDYNNYRKDVNRGNRLNRGAKLLQGNGKILGGEYSRRRRIASIFASAGTTTAVNTAQKRNFAKAVGDETAQEYFAKRALGQEGFAEEMGGSASKAQSLKASAQSAVDKILKQDVASREILLTANVKFKNNAKLALDEAFSANNGSGDRVQADAAISMLMKTGNTGYNQIYDSIKSAEDSGKGNTPTMEAVRDYVKENGQAFKAKDPALLRWATQDRSKGPGKTLAEASNTSDYVGKSDTEVAGFSTSALERAKDFISAEQAKSILSNPNLVKDTSPGNIKTLNEIIAKSGGSPQQLNIAHEEAIVQNNLYDRDHRQ